MSAKLTYITPLWVIANGVRYSHDNHHLSDSKEHKWGSLDWKDEVELIGDKDYKLIKKVFTHMFHLSVGEHSMFVFIVKDEPELESFMQKHPFIKNEDGSNLYIMNLRTLYEEKFWLRKLIYAIYEAGFIKNVDLLVQRKLLEDTDKYEVWDNGNLVKINKLSAKDKYTKIMLISETFDKDKYLKMSYTNKFGKRKTLRQHIFLRKYFMDNYKNKNLQVNHKDGNKQNNSLDNLELVTAQENIKHKYDVLGYTNNKQAESKYRSVYCITLNNIIYKQFKSMTEASQVMGCSQSQIYTVCKHIRKTCKGYKWEYADNCKKDYKEGDIYEG